MTNILSLLSVGGIDIIEVDGDPSIGVPAVIGSIAIWGQVEYGSWQKVGPLDTDWRRLNPGRKSGSVSPSQWVGNPRKFTVVFDKPFPIGRDYSIEIGAASDGRTWTFENKTEAGFVINSNAFAGITGQVTWSASLMEETS